ncbi:hypothetical protein RSOL_548600, partial [Rhizoctonia solani AG-3 Rhs1AP]
MGDDDDENDPDFEPRPTTPESNLNISDQEDVENNMPGPEDSRRELSPLVEWSSETSTEKMHKASGTPS